MAYSDADRLLTVRGTLIYPDAGTQALTSAHISSFIVNEDAGRDVPVGAAPASSFELKLDNSSGQWEPGGSILGAHILDGAKAEIEIGLWNGATYNYSDIGTYYIDDVQGQEHETLIRLKGSDAMVSLMSEYYADGAGDYPQTLGSLLTDVASVAGVTLESAVFTNSAVSIPAQPAWKNNLTCREAVGYIAACAGGIARFNRAGKLEITPLEKVSSRAVSTSVYKTIQKGDTFFGGLNTINVYAYGAPDGTAANRYATTPATPDTSLNSINIKGNPILAHGSTALATLGAGMLSALTGLAFRGATFEWHGDPAVELGELCTVTDLSSTAIPILITKQTLRFAPGFTMNSGCAVTTSTKADASGKLQKIFTPTGNLNAEALAGNIYVKAGEIMTLESDGIMNILSGGEMNIASGGKLTLASGNDVDIGADTLADLLAAATSQTTIWYQTSQPTATATGDLWYDTDAVPVTIKRWNGSSWVDITTTALSQALTAAGYAQATADGKIKTFAQNDAPSATAVGDLWVDTNDNNKLYRATAAGNNWALYKIASGYVNTSYITIDNDSIDIVSGGNLNIKSGGDIEIEGGADINVASTGKINIAAGGEFNLASTGKMTVTTPTTLSITAGSSSTSIGITNSTYFLYAGNATPASAPFSVTMAGAIKATSGTIGGFSIDASRHYYGDARPGYVDNYFVDLSKWGLAVGKDRSYPNNYFPVRMNSEQLGSFGHFMAINGNVGVLAFSENALSVYSYTSNNIYTGMATRTKKVHITASNGHIQTKGSISIEGNFDCPSGIVVAGDWVDFTPGYKGASAVAELRGVRNNEKGNIDHATLPLSARKKVKLHRKLDDEVRKGEDAEFEKEEVDGRSIGTMVSILTKAIQELDERLDKLEARNGQRV